MGKYTNQYIPTILKDIKYNSNDVGFIFRSIDYEGAIRFTNNAFIFSIGDNTVLTIGSAGISSGTGETLPDQTSNTGKFLYTNGVIASWAVLPSQFPTQTSNSGKFLTTNGTTPSWSTVPSDLHIE